MSFRRPKVSCLMPTRGRFALFQRSLACYCRQTWLNKELVVVSEGTAEEQERIADHVDHLGRDDIRLVFLEGEDWNLGKLRNQTLDHASGELLCQWDDDDMSHPLRLEKQVQALVEQNATSSFLTEQLHYFQDRQEIYWVDWNYECLEPEQKVRVIPGTVMCRRGLPARYPEEGPFCEQHEDTVFRDQVRAAGPVAAVRGQAYLYIYCFHGDNVFSFNAHWNHVRRKAVDADLLRGRRRMLANELGRFPWDGADLSVRGRDGEAFVYRPERLRTFTKNNQPLPFHTRFALSEFAT